MRQKLPHERTRREPTLRDPTLLPRSLAEALEPTRAPKAPRRIRSRGEPGRFSRLTKNLVVPRPVIDPSRCTACGTCVRVCPVHPKAVDFTPGLGVGDGTPPAHDYGRCIRCYCCQEMCPEHAIGIARPLLGRIIHR